MVKPDAQTLAYSIAPTLLAKPPLPRLSLVNIVFAQKSLTFAQLLAILQAMRAWRIAKFVSVS